MTMVRRWATLTQERRALEARLDEVKAALSDLDRPLQRAMVNAEIAPPYALPELGLSVGIRRDLWAGPKDGDMESLCAAMKAHGAAALVKETIHHMTLTGWVREHDATGQPIPEGIHAYLEIAEKFSVTARAMNASAIQRAIRNRRNGGQSN
jgi:hypothetical protein